MCRAGKATHQPGTAVRDGGCRAKEIAMPDPQPHSPQAPTPQAAPPREPPSIPADDEPIAMPEPHEVGDENAQPG
jgi:hypothetical protein